MITWHRYIRNEWKLWALDGWSSFIWMSNVNTSNCQSHYVIIYIHKLLYIKCLIDATRISLHFRMLHSPFIINKINNNYSCLWWTRGVDRWNVHFGFIHTSMAYGRLEVTWINGRRKTDFDCHCSPTYHGWMKIIANGWMEEMNESIIIMYYHKLSHVY